MKRKAIVKVCKYLGVAMVALIVESMITSAIYEERLQERQQYAQNAYNLGKAEYLGADKIPPEKFGDFQRKIQQTVNSSLSLQEQEKAMEEIYSILLEYSDANIILPKKGQ